MRGTRNPQKEEEGRKDALEGMKEGNWYLITLHTCADVHRSCVAHRCTHTATYFYPYISILVYSYTHISML